MAGTGLVVLSAAGFGTMAVFAKLAYDAGADVHGVLLVRFLLAALLLRGLMALTGTAWPRARDLRILLAMGAVGYVVQSLTYFAALTRLPAGTVAVVFYSYPVLVTVAVAVLSRQAPRLAAAVGCLLATVGVAVVAGPSLSGDALGLLLAATAAVTYTGYILAGSRLSPEVSPVAATTVVCTAAAAVYAVGWVVENPSLPSTPGGWAATAATAVVSTVLAIPTFFAGIKLLGPAPAAAISSAEPIFTALSAFLVFDERLSAWQVVGAGLVCVSVAVVSLASTPTQRAESSAVAVDR
ncbi:DMT family transporter [Motilibacter aurantiacus]|uniref:DMT family transporter n=1 Tax=Motilibacter aurantiacus TaxID=2714955 RepID=UPI001409EE60|nr:DMT family transporter [Motilibacter aurantiacus]NHC43777.1 DMT family transporter [Motilibacter aurantiacus]